MKIKTIVKPQKRTIFFGDTKYFLEFPEMEFNIEYNNNYSKSYFIFEKLTIKHKKPILFLNNSLAYSNLFNYHTMICMGHYKQVFTDRNKICEEVVKRFFNTKFDEIKIGSHFDYVCNWEKFGLDAANERFKDMTKYKIIWGIFGAIGYTLHTINLVVFTPIRLIWKMGT